MTINYHNYKADSELVHLDSVIDLAVNIFGEKIRKEIELAIQMPDALMTLAIAEKEIVGFKLGFKDVPLRFYSSTGGVKEAFRGQGIASSLIKIQHQECQKQGFKVIRTETKNDFRAMINLNLKNGFKIIGSYTDHRGEPKLILEKRLI